MPADHFLTEDQAGAFGRFVGDPSRAELDQFFYLDAADLERIAEHRGEHNRLGFALQLGTARFLGAFLSDPLDVPWVVVDYLAAQLGVADPTVIKQYAERVATSNTHAREIRRFYGYRDFTGGAVDDLDVFIYSRAWTHGEGPTALFEHAVAWLRRRRILLPGVTRLSKTVQGARERAASDLHERLTGAAKATDPLLPGRLRGLLSVDEGARESRLELLRAGPVRLSGPAMNKALARVGQVHALGVGAVDTSGVPAARLRALARYGLEAKAQSLRRLAEPRRTATLIATVDELSAAAVDDALDLFDALMASRVLGPSKRAAAMARLETLPELEKASTVLARVGHELVCLLEESGTQVDVETVWARLERIAAREQITRYAEKVGELVPDASGLEGAMRVQVARRYRTVAPFLGLLATALPLRATTAGQPVLDALAGLADLRGRRQLRREDVNEALVSAAWQAAVFGRDGVEVDREAWVLCVLEQLRIYLRRRDVFASPSSRWCDPRAQLLDGEQWQQVRDRALTGLGLEGPVAEHLSSRLEMLDTAWRALAVELEESGSEGPVRLEPSGKDGRIRLAVDRLDALDIPDSLRELREQVAGMLPRVDLPELLLEVHSWTGFLDAYTHIGQSKARMEDLPRSVAALLVAEACNVGLTPVIAEGHPALTRDRLGHVDANYLRTETHAAANATLIQAQGGIPVAQVWGGGLLASVDGLRFVVPVRTINAAPNPKYFGQKHGLTWFNAVNDQVAGIGATVVPGTVRDSLYVLDTILNLDGGPRPEMITSDTASYSDMVFGIFALLGYRFSPRIAALSDQRLWRAALPGAAENDYGPLNEVARNRINPSRITTHWEDMTRVAASLATGTVRAYDLLRMLSRDGNPSPLGAAITEYGRIDKTIHLLALINPADETYRRTTNTQLTVQESRHRLARTIFHGRRGQIHQRYREGQEDQLGALGLVLNAVVLWNTRYTDAAVTALREAGHQVRDTDIARLSPLGDQHINMLGRYAFTTTTPTGLRPLRAVRDDH
ncbi:Tn3 family transposase [Arthrobacter sp. 35W]|uniref:Tn3 family transposase n=1 Tax=Arthrobacter sp. 35W TaxID=1132441 RepID=UPI000479DCE0|nr:Tn3 family transposase [Arthrobacter sp. 35W]